MAVRRPILIPPTPAAAITTTPLDDKLDIELVDRV